MALFGSLSYFIAQRTLWIGRANNAWGSSRLWNSGSSFETDAANNLANYNNEVTAFNNLQNGLNNPDGLQATVAIAISLAGGGGADHDYGTTTLTFGRSGHFAVGFFATGTHTNVGFGTYCRAVVGGTAGLSQTQECGNWTNTGSGEMAFGHYAHVNVTSGQTYTVDIRGDFLNTGSVTGTIFAHFVPDATHHN